MLAIGTVLIFGFVEVMRKRWWRGRERSFFAAIAGRWGLEEIDDGRAIVAIVFAGRNHCGRAQLGRVFGRSCFRFAVASAVQGAAGMWTNALVVAGIVIAGNGRDSLGANSFRQWRYGLVPTDNGRDARDSLGANSFSRWRHGLVLADNGRDSLDAADANSFGRWRHGLWWRRPIVRQGSVGCCPRRHRTLGSFGGSANAAGQRSSGVVALFVLFSFEAGQVRKKRCQCSGIRNVSVKEWMAIGLDLDVPCALCHGGR